MAEGHSLFIQKLFKIKKNQSWNKVYFKYIVDLKYFLIKSFYVLDLNQSDVLPNFILLNSLFFNFSAVSFIWAFSKSYLKWDLFILKHHACSLLFLKYWLQFMYFELLIIPFLSCLLTEWWSLKYAAICITLWSLEFYFFIQMVINFLCWYS